MSAQSICQQMETSGAPSPGTVGVATKPHAHSYGEILRSTSVIGASSVLNIGFGIVRAKAMAVLLGPSGLGVMGVYGSISDVAQALAGLGVQSSGVRQIAEAVGSGDLQRIALTAAVLRRTAIVLAVTGAVSLVLLADPLSRLTFGTAGHASGIALLSLAVFCRVLSGAQGALIQGTRRIADLARSTVFGALLGTVLTVPLVYVYRQQAIVPSLVVIAAISLVASTWYSRRIPVPRLAVPVGEVGREAAALLKLGLAFTASTFLTTAAAYITRTLVYRNAGADAAGLYQAAWALGGVYVGFILQAMGADFYPRLTGVSSDNAECNRLINEQAHVGILIAIPGVIATVAFASTILSLLYSPEFSASVSVLRWLCLGVALRVVTWPLGFLILAKGRPVILFGSELTWALVNVSLTWACVRRFGLDGAGVAFFGSYIVHGCVVYAIARRLSDFRWTPANRQAALVAFGVIAIVLGSALVLPARYSVVLGAAAALLTGIASVRVLASTVGLDISSLRHGQGWVALIAAVRRRGGDGVVGRNVTTRPPRARI